MKKYQSFNPRTNAWVVYNQYADGHCKIVDVKQREPGIPFKGIQKKGRRK